MGFTLADMAIGFSSSPTPLAEMLYNTTYHGATKMSAHKVVLDNPPIHTLIFSMNI